MKIKVVIIAVLFPMICLGQQDVKDRFIDKILHSTWRGCTYWIPLTIRCNDSVSDAVANNAYLYKYFENRYNYDKETYVSVMEPILKNKDTLDICIDSVKQFVKGKCLISQEFKKIPDSTLYTDIDKLLSWAFNERGYLIKMAYFDTLVKILFDYNIVLHFGDEDPNYFYRTAEDLLRISNLNR